MTEISLSYSKLETLARCPQQFFRRYVLHEPDVISGALIIGRAFHKAMEHNFRAKMAHGVDLGDKEVISVYRDAFAEDASKPLFFDLEALTEDQIDWAGEHPKDVRSQGEKALGRYLQQHAPFVDPASVEERMEMEIEPGVTFVGIADVITKAGLILDMKTTSYAWDQDRCDLSFQPSCYGMLLGRPVNFDFHFITRKPKSPFGISIRRTHRTAQDIHWLRAVHLPQILTLIRQELWVRNPGQQCESCAHRLKCGYRVR